MRAEIDIEEVTNLAKMPVLVNDKGPFLFDFDTGASTTTLSRNLVERLGISTYKRNRNNARGLGGEIPTDFARACLKIGELVFEEDEVYVFDINKLLRCGDRDGVLGHSTLKHCIISLDYPHKTIRISNDSMNQFDSRIKWSRFEYINETHLIGIPVIINDQGPFDFVLDTGAGNTVITPNLANRLGLDIVSIEGIARGIGGEIELKMATLDYLSTCAIRLDSLHVAVIDLTKVSPKGDLIQNGIIGFDFLRNLETIIDYPRRQISFIDYRNSCTTEDK